MKERIGRKVKNLRQEKLMTQSELAGDKITRSMLSLIEHGNSEPSLSSLAYLADRLHVSPAYLLADEKEDDMYRRASAIGDIRIAYATGEYRICLDLCRALGLPNDDELNLLLADASIALAVEEIAEGNLHAVGEYLESAVSYAEATRYRVSHVYAEAAVLSRYITRFSEAFYSGNEALAEEKGIPLSAAGGDPFCAYALILDRLEHEEATPEELRRVTAEERSALQLSSPLLAMHIEVLLLIRERDSAGALDAIRAVLGEGERLPVPVLYEIFRDQEICAREMGDYKGAYESASAKHDLLSRLLSEF
ncbi:MAG: helix-turn-helix transcriptional regulator [Clostridia bacterium]|nr:helix-turn-helix transcriptional regulator [Clostridia bacterium]